MVKVIVAAALLALVGAAVAFPASPSEDGEFVPRRIVNGTEASILEIPFQVSILFYNSQWCGGSILDQNTILTAAHCFDYYYDSLYPLTAWTIRVGSSYWASGGTVLELSSVKRHEQYNPRTYDYDVLIIKLASPLTYGAGVQPVTLASAGSTLADGQDIQVSGWGRLYDGGALPTILQKIVMPVLSRAQCETMFASINPITNGMFCAGFVGGEGDSCNGDSGGPLVDLNNVQYGLVSWGLACALEGFTGVYTYLPYFLDWIAANR